LIQLICRYGVGVSIIRASAFVSACSSMSTFPKCSVGCRGSLIHSSSSERSKRLKYAVSRCVLTRPPVSQCRRQLTDTIPSGRGVFWDCVHMFVVHFQYCYLSVSDLNERMDHSLMEDRHENENSCAGEGAVGVGKGGLVGTSRVSGIRHGQVLEQDYHCECDSEGEDGRSPRVGRRVAVRVSLRT
jgi:hypothetical protein